MKLYLALSLCLLGSIYKSEALYAQAQAESDAPLRQQIDAIVQERMEQYQIPGLAIGIVQGDSFTYSQGYGYRNNKTADAVTAESIFHTASISKLFTAQAIQQLAVNGKPSLDDKIATLLPQLQYSDEHFREVTVRQLLNHTAGLPDIKNYRWGRQHESVESLEKYMLAHSFKLHSPPGTTYQYSNLGYDLLGYLVQGITGVSFEDYVQEQILRPAGMITSDFRYFRIPERLRVSPHSKRLLTGNIYPRRTYPYTREHGPSSTLNASASELCSWMRFVLKDLRSENGSLFHPMIQPSTSASPYIGLGFQLFELEGYAVAGHFGGDQGFRSYLLLVPEENIGLVLLANCDYEEDFRQDILHTILRLLVS